MVETGRLSVASLVDTQAGTTRNDGWLQAGAVCLCPRGIGSLE